MTEKVKRIKFTEDLGFELPLAKPEDEIKKEDAETAADGNTEETEPESHDSNGDRPIDGKHRVGDSNEKK